MRAATLIRTALIVMFVASISLAGTTVVMTTAQTLLGQVGEEAQVAPPVLPGQLAQPEQPVQADPLDRQLRPYQVRLNPAGEVEGRVNIVNPVTGEVNNAQDMTIAFLQRGQVVAERRPGIEGRFQVPLAPGVYSVVGAGPDGYMAYAMHVLPAELTVNVAGGETQPVAFQEVLSELAIDTVAVPVTDLPVVVSLARSNIPPELLSPSPSGDAFVPGQPLTPDEVSQLPTNRDIALVGHQVQIGEDGRVSGRMHRIDQSGETVRIRRLNVFLVQGNQVIAQAPVSELGAFEFFDVEEGIYSFVAAGMDGLAAFTMQAVSGPNLAGIPEEMDFVMTHTVNGQANAGATTLPEDTKEGVDRLESANEDQGGGAAGADGVPVDGSAGGGGSGGSGASGGASGGGGYGGGGSGWAAAAIAAGVGAAIGYAASDDDDDRRVVSPALP